jgi:hypothetical protein
MSTVDAHNAAELTIAKAVVGMTFGELTSLASVLSDLGIRTTEDEYSHLSLSARLHSWAEACVEGEAERQKAAGSKPALKTGSRKKAR